MSEALTGATDVLVTNLSGLSDHHTVSTGDRDEVQHRALQHWRMGAIFERAYRMATELAAAKAARPEDVQ